MKNFARNLITAIVILTLSLITVCSNYSNLFAQPAQEWAKTFDSQWGLVDYGRELKVDNHGNVYVAAHSLIDEEQNGVTTIIKYDKNGVVKWVYYSKDAYYMTDFTIDNKGNCYYTGHVWPSAHWDFLTVKLNSEGQEVWVATYDNGNWDMAASLEVDNMGNVYSVGFSIAPGSNYDLTLIKYDSSGQQQWVKKNTSPGNQHDFGQDIVLDSQGNIYMSGYLHNGPTDLLALIKVTPDGNEQWMKTTNMNREGGDVTPTFLEIDAQDNVYSLCMTYTPATKGDMLLSKYDTGGNELWSRTWNSSTNDSEYVSLYYADDAIELDNSGNPYICFTTKNPAVPYSQNIAVVKYTAAGDTAWSYIYNSSINDEDIPYSLAVDHNGNAYVAGYTNLTAWIGGEDYITIKVNANGKREWYTTFNGPGDFVDEIHAMVVDNTGHIYVTGLSSTIPEIFDPLMDIVTIKYSNTTVGITNNGTETPAKYELKQNYPNPFNPSTAIAFSIPRAGHVKLYVYNSLGEVVARLADNTLNAGSHSYNFTANNLASGIYFYKLQAEGFSETKKMLLVK